MTMKEHAVALLLSAALCLSLCACGPQEEEGVSSQSEPESQASSVITEYFRRGSAPRRLTGRRSSTSVEEGTFVAKDTNGDPVEITLGMTETPIRNAFEENGELLARRAIRISAASQDIPRCIF